MFNTAKFTLQQIHLEFDIVQERHHNNLGKAEYQNSSAMIANIATMDILAETTKALTVVSNAYDESLKNKSPMAAPNALKIAPTYKNMTFDLCDATGETRNREVSVTESDCDIHIHVNKYRINLQNYNGDLELTIDDTTTDDEIEKVALKC
jgi:hypothetical protein